VWSYDSPRSEEEKTLLPSLPPSFIAKHHCNGPAMPSHTPHAPGFAGRRDEEAGRLVVGVVVGCACLHGFMCGCYPPLCPAGLPLTPCRLRRRGLVCFVGDDHPPRGLGRLKRHICKVFAAWVARVGRAGAHGQGEEKSNNTQTKWGRGAPMMTKGETASKARLGFRASCYHHAPFSPNQKAGVNEGFGSLLVALRWMCLLLTSVSVSPFCAFWGLYTTPHTAFDPSLSAHFWPFVPS